MRQVERHLIKPNHKFYKEIDNLAFLSKNLYNVTLYKVRQEFFESGNILSFNTIYHLVKSTIDYKLLPAKVSQLIIKQVVNKEFYQKDNKTPKIIENDKETEGTLTLPGLGLEKDIIDLLNDG